MHPIITQHEQAIRALCERFQVTRLEVFGSAANGDFDPARSDLDFLVDFGSCTPAEHYERYFGLAESLESLLGRHVDLVEFGTIRNPYVLKQVNASRRHVYAA